MRLRRGFGSRTTASAIAAIGLVSVGFAGANMVGCGVLGCGQHQSGASAPRTSVAPRRPSFASRQATAHSLPRDGDTRLQSELLRELRLAGPGSGAYVYDLTAHEPVFSLRAGVGRPPASVEKLYTSVALLTELGPRARLRTKVLGTGSLGAGGVWHGSLYLRGGGDPTFGSPSFNRVWELGHGSSVTDLASQLAARGIRRVTGVVVGDASLFDSLRGGPSSRLAPDLGDLGGELSALTFNHGESGGTTRGAITPGALAAQQLVLALHDAHVQATAAPQTGLTPRRARLLADVISPPVSMLLRLMDVPSDDFFAEMLTKQLGVVAERSGSTAAGSRTVAAAVAAFGIHPTILDGSGLSRADRSSPIQVVSLLRTMWADPQLGRYLRDSLPVLGVNGTTREIARGTSAQGRCVAKTGTLDAVSNLAGYCHGPSNQQLAFAVFVDGPPNQAAFTIEGRIAADIVRHGTAGG